MLHKCFVAISCKCWKPGHAVIFLASLLPWAGVTPSRAGTLDIVVENSTAAPGMSGQLEVDLVNNSSSPVTIGAFSVDVLLSDSTFVNLTGIDNGTSAPYIFSIAGSFPPGFESNLLPMEAAGKDLSNGGQVVNPGDTWGLANLTYVVDPSAPLGTVVGATLESTSVFLPPPGGTNLSDPTGGPVPFTMVNGTITVQSSTTVPEPSSVALLGISGVILLVGTRFAPRRSARK